MYKTAIALAAVLLLSACAREAEDAPAATDTASSTSTGGDTLARYAAGFGSAASPASDTLPVGSQRVVTAPDSFGHADAFDLCKQAIRRNSKNAAVAVVPDVSADEMHGHFLFQWKNDDRMTLQNVFGARIDTDGECLVSAASRSIETLIVGDQVVVSGGKLR